MRREREGEKQRDKGIHHKDNHRQKTLVSTMGLSLRIQHKDHHRQKTLASSMGLSLFLNLYLFLLPSLSDSVEGGEKREGGRETERQGDSS